MRFPTDMKLLWESFEWLYRYIRKHCVGFFRSVMSCRIEFLSKYRKMVIRNGIGR